MTPDFYACPKSGKVISVTDYANGVHLQGPMRGHYEPVYYGWRVADAISSIREMAAQKCEVQAFECERWDFGAGRDGGIEAATLCAVAIRGDISGLHFVVLSPSNP